MPINRPTASELLEACEEFYSQTLLNKESGDITAQQKFHALVAANVIKIVQRELQLKDQLFDAERKLGDFVSSKENTCSEINASVIEAIHNGSFDNGATRRELLKTLKEIAIKKMAIDNPKYPTYRRLSQS